MSLLKFRWIAVNPHINPGEKLILELQQRLIYRLDKVISNPTELSKIEWIVAFNETEEINFEWAKWVIELNPDWLIQYDTSWSHGKPSLYLILRDNRLIPNGCTQVDTIETPEKQRIKKLSIASFLSTFEENSDTKPSIEELKDAIEGSFHWGKIREQIVQLIEKIFINDSLCELYKEHLPEIADRLCYRDSSLFSTVFTLFAEHMTEKEFREALEFVLANNNIWSLSSIYQGEIKKTITAISETGSLQSFEKCIPGTVPLKTPEYRSGFIEIIRILENIPTSWVD